MSETSSVAVTATAKKPSLSGAAGNSALSWVRFLGVAIIGASLDLWTKYLAFKDLGYHPHQPPVTVIPHVLWLKTTLNGGAVFGIGQGLSLMFAGISLIAIAFLVYVFVSSHRRHWVVHIALGLILAGAIGNMYDRIFNHGMVRDFILLAHWPWIFNIADSMLCIGVPLLVLCWILLPGPRYRNHTSTENNLAQNR
jgi:signal peptidase II